MTDKTPHWYCVNKDGVATLCADEEDAKACAAEAFVGWPHMGPHRAVQLVELASQPAAQGWISVDERLPEPFREVLIHPRPTDYCCEGEVNTQGQWIYREYEQNFGVNHFKCKVTHWKPNPPPFAADGGENLG